MEEGERSGLHLRDETLRAPRGEDKNKNIRFKILSCSFFFLPFFFYFGLLSSFVLVRPEGKSGAACASKSNACSFRGASPDHGSFVRRHYPAQEKREKGRKGKREKYP